MHNLIFLTGNKNKLSEAQAILGGKYILKNHKLDIREIQSTDVAEVVTQKIKDAFEILQKPVFVEDTGLYISNLNNFPGALIKSYYDHLGNTGICRFSGGSTAYAKTVIGFHDGKEIHIFEGIADGKISEKPRGEGFGWDSVFIPKKDGEYKYYIFTFAEMEVADKNKISQRAKAFIKFKKYLTSTF